MEEEHAVLVRPRHDACARVAEFDCSMVTRCHQVRISLSLLYTKQMTIKWNIKSNLDIPGI